MITITIDGVTYDIKKNDDGAYTIYNPDLNVTHTDYFTGKFVEFKTAKDAVNSLINSEETLLFA